VGCAAFMPTCVRSMASNCRRCRGKTIQRLVSLLPEFARPDNPLDVTGSGFLQGLNEIVRAMLEDENLNIIAPIFIPPHDKDDPVGFLNESYMSLIDTVNKPVIPDNLQGND